MKRREGGLTRGERRTLAWLGAAALIGLAAALWQQQQPSRVLKEGVPAQAAEWSHALSAARQVDVNTADVAELERLPGVGPALAARIVAYRMRQGPFASVDEVARVSGIGPKTLAALAGYLTIEQGHRTNE